MNRKNSVNIDITVSALLSGLAFKQFIENGGKVSRKEFLCYEEEDQVFYINAVVRHQTHRLPLICCSGVCYDTSNNEKVENLIVFADELHNRLNIFSTIM